MAVNYADGITFAGVIVCPICSALYLAGANVGWFTVPCVVAAMPICIAVLCVARLLTYSITGLGLRFAEALHPSVREILFLPFVLLYFLLPFFGVAAAVLATSYAAAALAEFAGHLGGLFGLATLCATAVFSVSVIVASFKWWANHASLHCVGDDGSP